MQVIIHLFFMKKILLTFAVVLCAMFSFAGDYDYITFITSEGSQQIASTDLVMTISGSNLVADNGYSNLTITLSKLQKMYFSDKSGGTYTGLDTDELNQNESVHVFTIEGKNIGSYAGINTAALNLPQGSYIIRQKSNSIKIIVP